MDTQEYIDSWRTDSHAATHKLRRINWALIWKTGADNASEHSIRRAGRMIEANLERFCCRWFEKATSNELLKQLTTTQQIIYTYTRYIIYYNEQQRNANDKVSTIVSHLRIPRSHTQRSRPTVAMTTQSTKTLQSQHQNTTRTTKYLSYASSGSDLHIPPKTNRYAEIEGILHSTERIATQQYISHSLQQFAWKVTDECWIVRKAHSTKQIGRDVIPFITSIENRTTEQKGVAWASLPPPPRQTRGVGGQLPHESPPSAQRIRALRQTIPVRSKQFTVKSGLNIEYQQLPFMIRRLQIKWDLFLIAVQAQFSISLPHNKTCSFVPAVGKF